MATPKRFQMTGTIISRRNKCLILTLTLTIGFIILFLNAGVLVTVDDYEYTGELCKLKDIPLQKDFDKKKFSGNWFAGSIKGPENAVIAKLLQFYDVKVNFTLDENGDFLVKSVGGKFFGMWCPKGEGRMTATDPQVSQRTEILFDTPTGRSFGKKPVWLVQTDYTSYAVLYSCWQEREDGSCEPSSAYIGYLQRTKDPLPERTEEEIRTVIGQSCIDPNVLRPVPHQGYCQKEQEAIS